MVYELFATGGTSKYLEENRYS